MDENNQKPRVEYSEFRRMLEEMRGNKENSAQDDNNELTNNIKQLVIVVKELTKNITQIIGGQRTSPMGTTPFSATLVNNNPKIQSDEDQLEAIKREDEQTELLRIIARNTGYREKANPEKPEEYSGGLLSNIALAGVAVAGLFYGYFKTWFKVVKGLFDGITKVLKGAYELILPESLRKNISESFSRIGTFFSELGNKAKALFVFEEGSAIGKAITAVKNGFSSIGGVLSKIGEGISGTVKAIAKIPGMSAFLKIAGTTFAFATGVGEIIAIAITIYDTVNGAIEGWKKGGFVGAITGALQGLIGGFVGGFADFIKSITSWTLGALGFESAEKWLDSFSFQKIINNFIEVLTKPFQILQDAIMHPIDSLKKLGGVMSDAFSKIAKVFDPVIEFFSGIGKSVVGMLEGIGIPEIGFTIPVIGKKVSIGPFYPFKADSKKPVAPEAGDSAAKMPAEQVANVGAKTNTKGSGTFNKAGFTPDGKIYEFKSEKEIDDAVESGKLFPQVAETRREILNTRKDASGMRPGETRTIVGGVPTPTVETKGGKVGPNWAAALKDYDSSWTPADHLSRQFPGINQKFRELAKKNPPAMDDMQSIEVHEKMLVAKAAGEMERGKGKASPIVEKSATPIPGGGQITDPNAQNYNSNYAEFRREMDGETPQPKAPEKASPIVEAKGRKVGPNWAAALKDYDSSYTPADHLKRQYPGIDKKFIELAKKNPPRSDDLQSIEIHEKMLVTKALGEMERGKQIPNVDAGNIKSAALTPAASTGNIIEAKTSEVANSRDALTTSGNGGSAIVNAPTTVNNTNQNTTVAKSPFRNEEGTINKYYSTRLGAY